MTRFLSAPLSVRSAVGVIVSATAVVVVLAGVAMRVLDHSEYSNVWVGMWWALQTVTTVGYGDVIPAGSTGKVIGGIEMVLGVSFISFLTAGVTSAVIQRSQDKRHEEERVREIEDSQRLVETLGEIRTAITALERRLS